jgi:hypothetical protein
VHSVSTVISLRPVSLLFSSFIGPNTILRIFYKKLSIFYFNADVTPVLTETSNLPTAYEQ